jgi:hypothetical protein
MQVIVVCSTLNEFYPHKGRSGFYLVEMVIPSIISYCSIGY